MRRLLLALAVLVSALVLVAGYALLEARRDPVVRRAAIALPDWPRGAPPIRAVLLSDVHLGGPAMDADRLERVVDQVNALRPDLVLIAGDLVDGHDPVAGARYARALGAPLSRLRAPLGVVAVLGNHDWWTAPDMVRAELARAGATVLENEAVRRGPLAIGGVGDAFTNHARPWRVRAALRRLGGAAVVLTHAPDVAGSITPGVPVLAGHTHCGQIVLPLIGPAVATSPLLRKPLYDPRYRCGFVHVGGRAVVVTAGLGTSVLPFRLGAPPDVWLLTFGSAE